MGSDLRSETKTEEKMTPQKRWALRNPEKRREINRRSKAKARYGPRREEVLAQERIASKRKYQKRKRKIADYWCRRKYGIGVDEKEQLFTEQECRCAACGATKTHKWAVDHDPKTGAVRGILCLRCNTVLGFLEDANLMGLLDAYLDRSKWIVPRSYGPLFTRTKAPNGQRRLAFRSG